MTTLPKIDRSGSLALWLQGRRRRRIAPLLRAEYPSKLAWAWTFKDPHKWMVKMSMDGGATWVQVGDYWMYGYDRLFAPDGGGELYYIVGVNEAGNEITGRSNIIRPDDAPSPSDLLTSLLAYWKLDESSGNLADSSGNGKTAIESGPYPTTRGVTGKINSAVFCEDADIWLTAPVSNMMGNFSISFWINSTTGDFFTCLSQTDTGYQGWLICSDGGTPAGLTFQYYSDEDGGGSVQVTAPSVIDGAWHHIVCVKNGLGIKIYKDGVLAASDSYIYDITPAPSDLTFFTNSTATYQYFYGYLDEVGIWERALSGSEVSQLYNAGDGLAFEWF